MEDKWIVMRVYINEIYANIAKGVLTENGIACYLRNSIRMGFELSVKKSDETTALKLLK